MFRRLCFSFQNQVFGASIFASQTSKLSRPLCRTIPSANNQPSVATLSSSCKMGDSPRPRFTIPALDKATRPEILRALESFLGSPFSTNPTCPSPSPLVIVISGPSGVGKDAVIKRLREERVNLHFVITATSREMRPGEIDGKDYYFVSKDEFVSMIENNELLEYALVYGDYKGIPKKQIKEYLASGCDIILRVDIQGAATLRKILGDSAIFVFLVAESELKLVERLIDRKSEKVEDLLIRIATAKEEMKYVNNFDYVVVNAEGKLDETARLIGSIIDAEKTRVVPRPAKF